LGTSPIKKKEGKMSKRIIISAMTAFAGIFLFSLCAPKKQMLWNGKDLEGWAFVLENDSVSAKDVWSVKDGVILCKGAPNGYMRTKESYSDYRLHVEWRWPVTGGNSGVFLHLKGPDQVWPNCIECQLHSGNAGDFVLIGPSRLTVEDSTYRVADRFQAIPKRQAASEKAVGEWNRYDIVASGDTIRCSVNGVLQNKGVNASQSDGPIGLQSEGTPVEFRNVWIQPLR
jgi:hypothetical protein